MSDFKNDQHREKIISEFVEAVLAGRIGDFKAKQTTMDGAYFVAIDDACVLLAADMMGGSAQSRARFSEHIREYLVGTSMFEVTLRVGKSLSLEVASAYRNMQIIETERTFSDGPEWQWHVEAALWSLKWTG